MGLKQIETGKLEVVCQPWVHSSSGEQCDAGFSLHLTFDAVARYLYARRQEMPVATPSSYAWIDWRRSAYWIGVSDVVAMALYNTEDEGLRFGPDFVLPEKYDA